MCCLTRQTDAFEASSLVQASALIQTGVVFALIDVDLTPKIEHKVQQLNLQY